MFEKTITALCKDHDWTVKLDNPACLQQSSATDSSPRQKNWDGCYKSPQAEQSEDKRMRIFPSTSSNTVESKQNTGGLINAKETYLKILTCTHAMQASEAARPRSKWQEIKQSERAWLTYRMQRKKETKKK